MKNKKYPCGCKLPEKFCPIAENIFMNYEQLGKSGDFENQRLAQIEYDLHFKKQEVEHDN